MYYPPLWRRLLWRLSPRLHRRLEGWHFRWYVNRYGYPPAWFFGFGQRGRDAQKHYIQHYYKDCSK